MTQPEWRPTSYFKPISPSSLPQRRPKATVRRHQTKNGKNNQKTTTKNPAAQFLQGVYSGHRATGYNGIRNMQHHV